MNETEREFWEAQERLDRSMSQAGGALVALAGVFFLGLILTIFGWL